MGIHSVITITNRVCALAAKLVCWLTLTMALTTFAVVVLRYGFNVGWIALQEAVMYQHACVFMLYSAFALQNDAHVRVDVFYGQWPLRKKCMIDIVGTVLFLWPVCITFIAFSWGYVAESWRLLEGSKEAGGLPFVFVLKSFIPVFSFLMLIQSIGVLGRCWLTMQKQKEQG